MTRKRERRRRGRGRRGRGEAYTLLSRVPPAWQPHAGCPEWGDERTRGTQPAGQPHTPLSLQGRYHTLPFSFPLFLYSSCVARSNASTPPHLSSSLLISSDKYLRNISFVMKEVVYLKCILLKYCFLLFKYKQKIINIEIL